MDPATEAPLDSRSARTEVLQKKNARPRPSMTATMTAAVSPLPSRRSVPGMSLLLVVVAQVTVACHCTCCCTGRWCMPSHISFHITRGLYIIGLPRSDGGEQQRVSCTATLSDGSISASPTACLVHVCRCPRTRFDRLGESLVRRNRCLLRHAYVSHMSLYTAVNFR